MVFQIGFQLVHHILELVDLGPVLSPFGAICSGGRVKAAELLLDRLHALFVELDLLFQRGLDRIVELCFGVLLLDVDRWR